MAGVEAGGTNVTVQPEVPDGILSMVQNTVLHAVGRGPGGLDVVDYNADSAYGSSGGFATGSTYKVFTLAECSRADTSLSESVSTTEHTFQQTRSTNSCVALGGEPWQVANAENSTRA